MNPWDALKSMTAADIVARTLAFNESMENEAMRAMKEAICRDFFRYQAFLSDLQVLTNVHGIAISDVSCGDYTIMLEPARPGHVYSLVQCSGSSSGPGLGYHPAEETT